MSSSMNATNVNVNVNTAHPNTAMNSGIVGGPVPGGGGNVGHSMGGHVPVSVGMGIGMGMGSRVNVQSNAIWPDSQQSNMNARNVNVNGRQF